MNGYSVSKRLRRVSSLVLLMLLFASQVWAAPVYIESAAPDAGRGIVYYGTNSGENRETWWGGQRLIRVSDTTDFTDSYELGVFCLEPFGDLPFELEPLEYTIGTLDDIGLNAIQQNRLQLLFDNAYSVLLDPLHPLHFSVRATAFQVSVWEILEDGATANPLDLTSGITRVDVLPADNQEIHDMFALATSWVGHLNAGDWSTTGLHQIGVLLSDDWQDLGFTVIVPEPSSMALAGLALIGLVALRRRPRA